jgi:TatD DNase family protein
VIDSHCHLADEVFAADLESVIARARDAGRERAMVILSAGDEKEAAQAARVEAIWPEVRFAIGVHPHHANQFSDRPERAADVVRAQIAATPGTRAVGEIGLDYHYDFAPRDVQMDVFRAQVRLARDLRLPVVIHTREADDDTIGILGDEGRGEVSGVLHCFTGGPSLARAGLDLGLYVSLAGIITVPKAAELRETVRAVPVERLLTETDSPFLAPVPYRGKRNEPAHVARVADALAALHGLSADELGRRAAANFHTLFRP